MFILVLIACLISLSTKPSPSHFFPHTNISIVLHFPPSPLLPWPTLGYKVSYIGTFWSHLPPPLHFSHHSSAMFYLYASRREAARLRALREGFPINHFVEEGEGGERGGRRNRDEKMGESY